MLSEPRFFITSAAKPIVVDDKWKATPSWPEPMREIRCAVGENIEWEHLPTEGWLAEGSIKSPLLCSPRVGLTGDEALHLLNKRDGCRASAKEIIARASLHSRGQRNGSRAEAAWR